MRLAALGCAAAREPATGACTEPHVCPSPGRPFPPSLPPSLPSESAAGGVAPAAAVVTTDAVRRGGGMRGWGGCGWCPAKGSLRQIARQRGAAGAAAGPDRAGPIHIPKSSSPRLAATRPSASSSSSSLLLLLLPFALSLPASLFTLALCDPIPPVHARDRSRTRRLPPALLLLLLLLAPPSVVFHRPSAPVSTASLAPHLPACLSSAPLSRPPR